MHVLPIIWKWQNGQLVSFSWRSICQMSKDYCVRRGWKNESKNVYEFLSFIFHGSSIRLNINFFGTEKTSPISTIFRYVHETTKLVGKFGEHDFSPKKSHDWTLLKRIMTFVLRLLPPLLSLHYTMYENMSNKLIKHGKNMTICLPCLHFSPHTSNTLLHTWCLENN